MKTQDNQEKVFEIGLEGGGVSIFRERGRFGEKFVYCHNEMDMTDEGLDVNEKKEFDDFEDTFKLIDESYPSWFSWYFLFVHEEYRGFVARRLVDKLNKFGHGPNDVSNLEDVLNIKLEFGNYPLRNGLQEIEIKYHNGINIDYEYGNYSGEYYTNDVRSDVLKMSKAIENIDWKIYKCKGKIDFSGSTVIIKDEFNQPKYVFSSDKAFITAKPILSQDKGWFYKSKY